MLSGSWLFRHFRPLRIHRNDTERTGRGKTRVTKSRFVRLSRGNRLATYIYFDFLFQVNTRFLLYSSRRSRRDTPLLDVSFMNMTSIWHWAGKAFNVSAPTKVIVHGFGSSCSNVWVYEMRSALMDVVSTIQYYTISDLKLKEIYQNKCV